MNQLVSQELSVNFFARWFDLCQSTPRELRKVPGWIEVERVMAAGWAHTSGLTSMPKPGSSGAQIRPLWGIRRPIPVGRQQRANGCLGAPCHFPKHELIPP